jgi:uncharacterized membrane protein required for colicin V production
MIIFFLILSFVVGSAVSSFFNKRKGEKFFLFRTYQLYQTGKVELMSVIIAAFINMLLGMIILGLIGFKYFLHWAGF